MAPLPRRKLTQATIFLVTVIVVTAAVTLGSLAGTGDRQAQTYPEFDTSSLIPEQVPAEGTVEVNQVDRAGVIAIDTSHSNRFQPHEINPLISALSATGYDIEYIEGSTTGFSNALDRADALIVIDPGRDYSADDIDRIETFTDNGGRLVVLGEPNQMGLSGFAVTSQPPRLSDLVARYGIQFNDAYLYNMEQNDGNFQNIFVDPAGPSRVNSGISQMVFFTATGVQATGGQPILVASEGTRTSRSDISGTYSVAVRKGNVVVVGDKSFLERSHYTVADNEQFIENLAQFLVSGSRTHTIHEYPAFISENPTIRYTSVDLLHAAQLVGNDLRGPRGQPKLQLNRQTVDPATTDILITTFDYLDDHEIPTGIITSGNRIRVAGYESQRTGIYVIRKPGSEIDLVIAADTTDRSQLAAEALLNDIAQPNAVSNTTIIERTSASQTATTPSPET